jgi:hypothetical protein
MKNPGTGTNRRFDGVWARPSNQILIHQNFIYKYINIKVPHIRTISYMSRRSISTIEEAAALTRPPKTVMKSNRMKLRSGRELEFSREGRMAPALVMAIINCTDDSFYPASRSGGLKALEKALEAEEDGAAIIDFGGESTRPGAG